jgi:hypothetical protein
MQWQCTMPGAASGIDLTFSELQLGQRSEVAFGHSVMVWLFWLAETKLPRIRVNRAEA